MKLLAATCVFVLLAVPVSVGLVTFCDPVFREADDNFVWAEAGQFDSLPDDGVPRAVVIRISRMDAWTRLPAEPIGRVFIRRKPGDDFEVLNSVCPANGVDLELDIKDGVFRDPCHGNEFTLEGKRIGMNLSPRDMDSLEVQSDNGTVWVKFQSFQFGRQDRVERKL